MKMAELLPLKVYPPILIWFLSNIKSKWTVKLTFCSMLVIDILLKYLKTIVQTQISTV